MTLLYPSTPSDQESVLWENKFPCATFDKPRHSSISISSIPSCATLLITFKFLTNYFSKGVAFKREPVDITESKPVSDKSLFLAVLFLWTLFATKALFQSQSSPQLFGFFVYFQRLDGHPPRYVGKWRT
ncbi:hypothetical protein RB195_014974 [Necator americanus]|uniref:Uncharacterized protein n=1 Tax=Necator americanus TaxID=51031 RepID=A0ABR1E461_NECAM